ncbi:MAG: response regulator transcription factor [Burkholderiales bacterium]|nr:response regulator transcription factor [Burkholderiales bacterium]
MNKPTALIVDDEPLLREHLRVHLARLWPELEIVGQARNGREAVELFEREQAAIVFLDVHMPGMNGIDAARVIGQRALIVFVTAFEQYAVTAFEQGAIDYLVKPFEDARLIDTVARLRQRQAAEPQVVDGDRIDALLDRLGAQLRQQASGRPWLQWIKASVGNAVRLIPVEQIVYLRSDEKYTLVVWEGGEALIRKPIRELIDELDPEAFVQVHRSVIVNLRHVAQVVRGANETADVHLKERSETLPVSRSYLHLFRQM